jgi:long-chain acyl-CoA synthetase
VNVTGLSLEQARRECERLARSSVPQIFAERVAESPDDVALRYKEHGIFRELTWTAYWARTQTVATGMVARGLVPPATIAIMADPCVEYLLAHLGAVIIGAIPYGIYPTSSNTEVALLLEQGGARIAFAGDQEHLDKLLEAERLAGQRCLDHIVLIDARTRFLYDDPRLISFAEFEAVVKNTDDSMSAVQRYIQAVTPDTLVGLIFTSGTTGEPKGAFYTHSGMMVGLGYGLLEVMSDLRHRPHRVVTHLPLAHGMGQGLSVFVPLFADVIQHLPERGQSLTSLMKDVRPTHVLGVPRIWQKIAAELSVQIEHSGLIRRKPFDLAQRYGLWRARRLCRRSNHQSGFRAEPLWRMIRRLMIWPALYKIGLGEMTGCASGGAPIPTTVIEKWQSWGLPLRNIYGSTEGGMLGSPTNIWAPPDAALVQPFPRRIQSGSDGEILVSGPGIFAGYWRDEAATAASFDECGRVTTGDIAEFFADNSYRIIDRKKDILITSGGKNVAPAAVESALKASPYISEAVIFGDGKKYLTALLEVNFDALAQWARSNDVQYTGFSTLIAHRDIHALLEKEVERANRVLARPEQVKYFRIMPKELDPEEGDTTPTRKIKRKHAYDMFKSLVDEMYAVA